MNILSRATTLSSHSFLGAVLLTGTFILSACVSSPPVYRGPDRSVHAGERWSAFKPNPTNEELGIDYSILDEILEGIVLNTGRSLRTRLQAPRPVLGSRIVRRTPSPLRVEGNKVLFSRFDQNTKDIVELYANALVRTGNEIDITSMPKNDQLAYWFNLHNVLVISQIAKHYPLRTPSALTVGPNGETLHDAPIARIKGVHLSLRDIRLNIVQRYWRDPRVIYGFFHGDAASPNIRRQAWTPNRLSRGLSSNALEFVNALRGVDQQRQRMVISPLYREARDTLFPDWPQDFVAHLNKFAEAPVKSIIKQHKGIEFARYLDRTADTIGGDEKRPDARIDNMTGVITPVSVAAGGMPIARPRGAFNAGSAEIVNKIDTLWFRGLRKTRVEIVDNPNEPQPNDSETIE